MWTFCNKLFGFHSKTTFLIMKYATKLRGAYSCRGTHASLTSKEKHGMIQATLMHFQTRDYILGYLDRLGCKTSYFGHSTLVTNSDGSLLLGPDGVLCPALVVQEKTDMHTRSCESVIWWSSKPSQRLRAFSYKEKLGELRLLRLEKRMLRVVSAMRNNTW